jgi:hypothetical protein
MPRRFAIAAGPNSARSCLICAASMLTGRPLYFPAAFALAMPSQQLQFGRRYQGAGDEEGLRPGAQPRQIASVGPLLCRLLKHRQEDLRTHVFNLPLIRALLPHFAADEFGLNFPEFWACAEIPVGLIHCSETRVDGFSRHLARALTCQNRTFRRFWPNSVDTPAERRLRAIRGRPGVLRFTRRFVRVVASAFRALFLPAISTRLVLTSCDLISEGLDVPSRSPPHHRETCCCVMRVRTSTSVGGAVQQLGKMGDLECEPELFVSYWCCCAC